MGVKLKSYGQSIERGEGGRNLGTVYVFHCPGCGYDHPFHTGGDAGAHPQWTFNGNEERPTFSPSLLCNKDSPAMRCHSFVRDGRIEFLADCWHALKGQTVDIPDWDEDGSKLRMDALRRNVK